MLSTPNYYDMRSNDINLQYIYNITKNIFLVHYLRKVQRECLCRVCINRRVLPYREDTLKEIINLFINLYIFDLYPNLL